MPGRGGICPLPKYGEGGRSPFSFPGFPEGHIGLGRA